MSILQALLAMLWPITGFLQAFAIAPEMFVYGFIKFITTGHL